MGGNTVNVKVKAQNGDEKIYTLTVDRAPSNNADLQELEVSEGTLSPEFEAGTTSYEVSVGNEVEDMQVTPTVADKTATVTVNGSEVTSGEASESIPLEVGENKITIEVTAQNGDENRYTVTVDRDLSSNADLRHLEVIGGILQPEFQKHITDYNMSVNNDVEDIEVTAVTDFDGAQLSINGKPALKGEITEQISLEAGTLNEVDITVIAEDSTIQSYQMKVTRLLQISRAALETDGQTATVRDEDVMIIQRGGILSIDLPEEINQLQLNERQMEYLISQNINIEIMKPDVEMTLPSSNFNNASKVAISLEKIESSDSIDNVELSAGSVYQFSIDQGGQTLNQFNYEVGLAFQVRDEETNPEELKVYYWNDELREWEYVSGEYSDGKILATTDHFSTFALFNPADLQEKDGVDDEDMLPKTASPAYNWMAIGALLMILGSVIIFYRRHKRMK